MDEKWLRKMILEEKKTYKEIAAIQGCSKGTVGYYVKKYNIPLRELPDRKTLEKIYLEENKSIAWIAKEYRLGLSTVKKMLMDNGIKIKSNGTNQFAAISFEKVKDTFEKEGYILLSDAYVNSKTPLRFICPEGHEHEMLYHVFKRGSRCSKCFESRRGSSRRFSYEEVKKFFEERNCILLSEVYVNANEKLEYICHCGNKASMTLGNFKSGYDCVECKRMRFKGANNHNYNPNLSEEERLELGRYEEGYKKFRREVYRRDKFTCVSCGSNKSNTLVAHHLDSYSEFPEKRTDVNNAVTLCESCHKEFHGEYGYGKNTKEQFEAFLANK